MSSPDFREALAQFPSGITLVTTRDGTGKPWGFAATSFCSVSADPPLVLVCLATSAQCHPVFLATQRWVIHIIHHEHQDLVGLFATRGADKFSTGEFVDSESGLPVLPDASAVIECERFDLVSAGDHTVLIGRVTDAVVNDPVPAIYYRRGFHSIEVTA